MAHLVKVTRKEGNQCPPPHAAGKTRPSHHTPAWRWDVWKREVLLSTSMPRVGSGWTDTGESFDTRGLKKRARKATWPVPIPPILVRLVRKHVKEFGTAEDGRLFRAAQGGHLLSKEYRGDRQHPGRQ